MMDGAMHDETVAWLSLSLVPGLGARGLYKLVDRFGTAQAVLHASPADIGEVTGLREEVGRGLTDRRRYIDQATAELHRLTRIGGRLLTSPDPAYPDVLRHLSPPPPILFVRGDVDLLHRPMAALVGTRAATSYGRRMAASLAGALA
ncbi:MAG TPA: DNA-protecting protein DprA, partial [Desulfofustis sp.]|nr:DNA-protecting protein DprA [Desulfofustis sp.]